ncbi:MAG: hypothetical protein II680_14835 [Clostridia bacterium]|nr:hypothetical protein [Clostridia bacterium]
MLRHDILTDASFMTAIFTRQYSDDRRYRSGKDLSQGSRKELKKGETRPNT